MADKIPPFIAIGYNELGEPLGDIILCPLCGKPHRIEGGNDAKTGKPTNLLQFYTCPETGKTYLAGIGGKAVKAPRPE